jgi:hypothetical protein
VNKNRDLRMKNGKKGRIFSIHGGKKKYGQYVGERKRWLERSRCWGRGV